MENIDMVFQQADGVACDAQVPSRLDVTNTPYAGRPWPQLPIAAALEVGSQDYAFDEETYQRGLDELAGLGDLGDICPETLAARLGVARDAAAAIMHRMRSEGLVSGADYIGLARGHSDWRAVLIGAPA
jgi:hypothetical protein